MAEAAQGKAVAEATVAANALARRPFLPIRAQQRSTAHRRLGTQEPTCQAGLRAIPMAIEGAFPTRSPAWAVSAKAGSTNGKLRRGAFSSGSRTAQRPSSHWRRAILPAYAAGGRARPTS